MKTALIDAALFIALIAGLLIMVDALVAEVGPK
jgi:hypothetical protein